MADEVKLLPCPFCGSANITYTESVEQAGGYLSWSRVECDDCEASSGHFKFEEAVEHWNRREPSKEPTNA